MTKRVIVLGLLLVLNTFAVLTSFVPRYNHTFFERANDTLVDVMYMTENSTFSYAIGNEDLTAGVYVAFVFSLNPEDMAALAARAIAQGVVQEAIENMQSFNISIYEGTEIRKNVSEQLRDDFLTNDSQTDLQRLLVTGQDRLYTPSALLGSCDQNWCFACFNCRTGDCCVQ